MGGAVDGHDIGDARAPFGQRAGLVEGDRLQRAEVFERRTALHQHTATCRARDAAIQGDLELATENLRDYLRKRRMPYFQYCPCKNCVIGLWHHTASHVTGFSR